MWPKRCTLSLHDFGKEVGRQTSADVRVMRALQKHGHPLPSLINFSERSRGVTVKLWSEPSGVMADQAVSRSKAFATV